MINLVERILPTQKGGSMCDRLICGGVVLRVPGDDNRNVAELSTHLKQVSQQRLVSLVNVRGLCCPCDSIEGANQGLPIGGNLNPGENSPFGGKDTAVKTGNIFLEREGPDASLGTRKSNSPARGM